MSVLLNLTNSFNKKTISKFKKEDYVEKVSSGKRINRAADDAAGLSISESFKAQVRGLSMAERNTQQAISMVQVADGALGNINDHLGRMKEIAIEAANGTYTKEDREAIDKEFQKLKESIENIAENTEFNGIKLLKEDKSINIQIKDDPYANYKLNLYNSKLTSIGLASSNIATEDSARDAITDLENASKIVVSFRARLGGDFNNLNHALNDNTNVSLNVSSSLSRIEDVDMGMSIMKIIKNDVLTNYNQSMISVAKQDSESVNAIINKWLDK